MPAEYQTSGDASRNCYFFGVFEVLGAVLDSAFVADFVTAFFSDLLTASAADFGLAGVFTAAFGFFSSASAALGLAVFLTAGLLAAFFESAFGLAFVVPVSSLSVAFAFAGFLAAGSAEAASCSSNARAFSQYSAERP